MIRDVEYLPPMTIKDSNGLITKTLTYDNTGKAISTAGINGVNKTEFDNGANAKGKLTKITDASGSMAFS